MFIPVLRSRYYCSFGSLFLIITFFLCAPFPVNSAEKNISDNNGVSGYRIKIRRLQHGIVHQKNQISENQTQEHGILQEIEVLDKKLSGQKNKLVQLKAKVHKQRSLIDREEKALSKIRVEHNVVEKHL